MRRQLLIARRCGWRYEWVNELDPEVWYVLLQQLHEEDAAQAQAR